MNKKQAKPQSFLVTDDAGMVLRIVTEGKWLVASSPFDPELITQAKTIDEAFAMAYDAKKGLDALRAEAARNAETGATVPRRRKPAASPKRPARQARRTGARA